MRWLRFSIAGLMAIIVYAALGLAAFANGESHAEQARPIGRRRRLRITVLGLLLLVASIAVALMLYRQYVRPLLVEERPTFLAVYRKVSPVADGIIGEKEYGPGVMITWASDNTLAAFENQLTGDATRNKPAEDLTITLYTAYSNASLYFAFRVHDQFVDAQEADRNEPWKNDGVEVFIDGDRVPNDLASMTFVRHTAGSISPSEGFQLLANAAGHKLTNAQEFSEAEWKAAARRTEDGYIIEIEIPLALIDTQDGPGYAMPGPGSLLNFALAVTDNDEEVSKQVSYAYLRTRKTSTSPWIGGEKAWRCVIKFEPKWSLFPW